MTIESIQGIGPLPGMTAMNGLQDIVRHAPSELVTKGDFSNLVAQGLSKINGDLLASEGQLQQLALGDGANLHQIMMKLEETKISFQLFMQARSRLLDAYQDITKMQI